MSTSLRISIIACLTLLVFGAMTFAYLGGKEFNLMEILQVVGALAAGYLIPSGGKKSVQSIILLLIVSSVSACSVDQAQITTQTALSAASEGFVVADRIVASSIPEAAERARNEIDVVMSNCGDACPDPMDLFADRMEPYYSAVRVLRISRSSLLIAQSAVDIWISTGNLPDDWGEVCSSVQSSVDGVIETLGTCGVHVPDILSRSSGMIEMACNLTVQLIQRR